MHTPFRSYRYAMVMVRKSLYRIFLCSRRSRSCRGGYDSACFAFTLSVTRSKDKRARLRAFHFAEMRCTTMCGTSVLSVFAPSPRCFPTSVIARDASLVRIEYLPSMLPTARLRIYLKPPINPLSLHTPHYCAHLSTRGKEAVETDGCAVHQTLSPPRKHASRSVGATSSLG